MQNEAIKKEPYYERCNTVRDFLIEEIQKLINSHRPITWLENHWIDTFLEKQSTMTEYNCYLIGTRIKQNEDYNKEMESFNWERAETKETIKAMRVKKENGKT